MPVPVAAAPTSVSQVQGQRDPSSGFWNYFTNPDVLSAGLGFIPGPLGYAGSLAGAYRPIVDTLQGEQSATSSQSGLFGGGMGGMLGHIVNWITGQLTGDTTGMTDTTSAGIGTAPGFMERNFGGLEHTVARLFGGSAPGSLSSAVQSLNTSPTGPQTFASSPTGRPLQPSAATPVGTTGQPGTAEFNPNLVAGNTGPALVGQYAQQIGGGAMGPGGTGFSLPSSVFGGTTGGVGGGVAQAGKG